MKNKELINELARHMEWDPSTEEYKEYDQRAIRQLFKRHFKDTEWEKKFEETGGDTLYKVMKNHPLCNLVWYATGEVTPEEMLKVTKEGLIEGLNRYSPCILDGEKLVSSLRTFASEAWEIRKSGVLDFDMTKVKLELPSDGKTFAINELLKDAGLPPIQNMVGELLSSTSKITDANDKAKKALDRVSEVETDIETLRAKLAEAAIAGAMQPIEVEADEDLGIPEGKVVMRKASELFDGVSTATDFDVPFWEWDGKHPDVPKIDSNYIFRPKELMRVLYAIVANKRIYLHGHTGSGKTTLIEQVCAHLNYPFVRVNFDSEITRMDLIGRDTLGVDKEGNTISEFVDGILPRAMSSPCIFCCDEIDFVRPDVAYVMQAALEGNGLRITEDGDKHVKPHPMFRMMATGNTVGQGDEHGMYQGARPQSLAFLDRFTIWSKVGYLEKDQREKLVKDHVPVLSLDDQRALSKYMDEHLNAFTSSKVLQPISPRGMLAIANATVIFGSLKEALEMTVLDRATNEDRAVLKGIVDRIAS